MISKSIWLTLAIFTTVIFLLIIPVSAHAQVTHRASAASYLERGNAWAAKGEWERAIADFDLAIAFDPSFAGAYYNRAIARHRVGNLVGALADLDRAIRLNLKGD